MRNVTRYVFTAYGYRVYIGTQKLTLKHLDIGRNVEIGSRDTHEIAYHFPRFPGVLKIMIKTLIKDIN